MSCTITVKIYQIIGTKCQSVKYVGLFANFKSTITSIAEILIGRGPKWQNLMTLVSWPVSVRK